MGHTGAGTGITATKGTTLPAIDRDALPAVAVGLVPAVLAALTGHRRTAAGLLALPLGIAAFFRDPDRAPDTGVVAAASDALVAPADGKIMYAGPAQDGVAPVGRETWQQVSIFLSLFDVHINRTPYGGRVAEVSYRPGRWLAAYRFESAVENERSEITVVDDSGRTIVFRQIVGLVARRVVTRARVGDRLHTGQRIGLMRFGSRMDVFVPPEVLLVVNAGERAVAGETVIGLWRA